jgi:hypothetical protein
MDSLKEELNQVFQYFKEKLETPWLIAKELSANLQLVMLADYVARWDEMEIDYKSSVLISILCVPKRSMKPELPKAIEQVKHHQLTMSSY